MPRPGTKTLWVIVTDYHYFPGTLASINSIHRFHPDAEIAVIENNVDKPGLTPSQRRMVQRPSTSIAPALKFEAKGRKLSAWELKAYGAADLQGDYDLLIGIDSDCVLCGPVDDVMDLALETGKFVGGRDNPEPYDSSYEVYGIRTPVTNDRYMSTSLYFCPLTGRNRETLGEWADKCGQAHFGGGTVYPGHGDQGVLNAILYKDRGPSATELLENDLWSQHSRYWDTEFRFKRGIFNATVNKPQRSLHSVKPWTWEFRQQLKEYPSHGVSYAWFLYFWWFGLCTRTSTFQPEDVACGNPHLLDDLLEFAPELMKIDRWLRCGDEGAEEKKARRKAGTRVQRPV